MINAKISEAIRKMARAYGKEGAPPEAQAALLARMTESIESIKYPMEFESSLNLPVIELWFSGPAEGSKITFASSSRAFGEFKKDPESQETIWKPSGYGRWVWADLPIPLSLRGEGFVWWPDIGVRKYAPQPTVKDTGIPGWAIVAGAAGLAVIVGLALRSGRR